MRIAVIGSGIAGLASAWLLARRHRVVLYESESRLGGHSNTVDITVDGITHPVDTGFLVFNHRTYPNLRALFRHFAVPTVRSEMTFSVRIDSLDLEWAGNSLATVFAQKSNLLRREFWSMLGDILRFNREAQAVARGESEFGALALGEFLDAGGYGRPFRDWYLLPMAGAIWSCPTRTMLDYPLATFANFCANHGLLQVENRPAWYTVKGGSREYVKHLAAGIPDIRRGEPVMSVKVEAPAGDGTPFVRVASRSGEERFDQVVMACHSDQTLRMLENPTDEERSVLGAIPYQRNRALLHTDASLLPRRRNVWSAWNYSAPRDAMSDRPVGVHYLINKLQPVPFERPVIVSLNPSDNPAPAHVAAEFDYAHPVFDHGAIDAQARLPGIQGRRGLWFCGAWCGYGFHEDGLKSALRVARGLGVLEPWITETADEAA